MKVQTRNSLLYFILKLQIQKICICKVTTFVFDKYTFAIYGVLPYTDSTVYIIVQERCHYTVYIYHYTYTTILYQSTFARCMDNLTLNKICEIKQNQICLKIIDTPGTICKQKNMGENLIFLQIFLLVGSKYGGL